VTTERCVGGGGGGCVKWLRVFLELDIGKDLEGMFVSG